jgi:CxxC motif-containing protein (DUF1111 family)
MMERQVPQGIGRIRSRAARYVQGVRRAVRERSRGPAIVAICLMTTGVLSTGCSDLLTTKPPAGTRFDQPLEGLDNGELGDFQDGQTQFRRAFAIAEGLGPIFNNVSCASCHSGDGRGIPSNILTRFSRGTDLVPGEGGPQIQDRAIPGAEGERLPAGVDVSRRLPPPVFGVGFIEALTDSTLLTHEDPSDSDADGISGRANWVTPPPFVPATEPGGGPGPRVGRFGRKAQVTSLLQQTVDAYHQDVGITTPQRPVENTNPLSSVVVPGVDPANDPELGGQEVNDVMQYMRMLAPPTPGEMTARRAQGATVFNTIRCGACHIPSMRTGTHEIEALSDRDVAIYSDLLLHDLGDELADNRPDGSADGREWRTAPLWGLRIAREFLNGQLFLLHDGRARSVEEAILFHGGEAGAVRDAFNALSAADREALLDYVESR